MVERKARSLASLAGVEVDMIGLGRLALCTRDVFVDIRNSGVCSQFVIERDTRY